MEKEKVYLRRDLYGVGETKVAYIRLDRKLVEFLNVLEAEGEEIVGIELDREDNRIGYNIGFIISNLEEEKDNDEVQ